MSAEFVNHLIGLAVFVFASLVGFGIIRINSDAESWSNIRKALRTIGPIGIVILSILSISAFNTSTGTEDLNRLRNVAAGINKSLPVMVDSDTKIVEVTTSNQNLIYHMVMVNNEAVTIDKDNFSQAMENNLKQNACSNPSYIGLFKENITVSMSYTSKDGVVLALVDLPPSTCSF